MCKMFGLHPCGGRTRKKSTLPIDNRHRQGHIGSMHTRNKSTVPLGETIRRGRIAKGLTLRAVAAQVGVSHGFIADIELGRRNVGPDTLTRIAEVVGLSAAALIKASQKERASQRLARLQAQIEELRAR